MKDHITKTISFFFSNKFTKQEVMVVVLPYLPFRATNGYYSQLYKLLKDGAAVGCERSQIVGKHSFREEIINRMLIAVNGGMSLDMPFDSSAQDWKIVLHYLEGLRMALSDKPVKPKRGRPNKLTTNTTRSV